MFGFAPKVNISNPFECSLYTSGVKLIMSAKPELA